jgi:hypothetical protein
MKSRRFSLGLFLIRFHKPVEKMYDVKPSLLIDIIGL